MRRLLVALVLVVLAVPGTAHAENAAQVAAALRSSPVYESPGLDLIDKAALTSELNGSDPQVDVAVLGASAAASDTQARQRAIDIGKALGDTNAVVLVITANRHFGAGEGSGVAARGVNARQALAAELANIKGQPFDKETITAFVIAFKDTVAAQASGSAGSTTGGSAPTVVVPQQGSGSSNHTGAYLLGGLVVIAGGATALAVRSSRNRRKRLNEGLRADVEQLYNRLGSDVATLDAGDNVVARQALADAAERYNAAGATLATADAPAEFAAARRTAVEGLTAARTARSQLGLDPGPEIPPPPGSGPQLTAEQQVSLGGQTYDGSPQYQPGRQHYYGGGYVGGQMVPGGWYSMPFWEPFLLGSILTGGFGGGFGGGGFERGYEEGREDAAQDGGGGGGDWGGGGGGDWGGGGGGDWGGGGGGDSGGGGGDW